MGKEYYVYGHFDDRDRCFYIGKGKDYRYSDKSGRERHPLWHYYVDNYLNGKYTVEILKQDLSEDEALEIESDLILELGQDLVNWVNPRRLIDFEMNQKYHILRNSNKQTIKSAKRLEIENINTAIELYKTAIEKIIDYYELPIQWALYPYCLVDKLFFEKGVLLKGEIEAIERLTICLCKLDRLEDAQNEALDYFEKFPDDRVYEQCQRIFLRVFKGSKMPFEIAELKLIQEQLKSRII
jgi:hypothetical protein